MKTETIEATIEAWTKDPEKALGAPVVTARADESQAVIEAGPFTWRADLPPALGGNNEAPRPRLGDQFLRHRAAAQRACRLCRRLCAGHARSATRGSRRRRRSRRAM